MMPAEMSFKTLTMARFALLSFILLALSNSNGVDAACECGYVMEDTGDLWTHSIVEDYSKFRNAAPGIPAEEALRFNWEVSDWERSGRNARIYQRENIWLEDGLLKLIQRPHSAADRTAGRKIRSAEIHTRRGDILFGSFRSEYRVVVQPNTKGMTCSGFFTYATRWNDSPEVDIRAENDIEILTHHNQTTIWYTKHVPRGEHRRFNGGGGSIHSRQTNLTTDWTQFQDHRMDLLQSISRWYNNGAERYRIDWPSRYPSRVLFNLWADESGSSKDWTPEAADKPNEMHIRYAGLYFNTTASHAGNDAEYRARCPRRTEDKLCFVNRCQREPSETRLGNVNRCPGGNAVNPPSPPENPPNNSPDPVVSTRTPVPNLPSSTVYTVKPTTATNVRTVQPNRPTTFATLRPASSSVASLPSRPTPTDIAKVVYNEGEEKPKETGTSFVAGARYGFKRALDKGVYEPLGSISKALAGLKKRIENAEKKVEA